jgi:hypothetical protein
MICAALPGLQLSEYLLDGSMIADDDADQVGLLASHDSSSNS